MVLIQGLSFKGARNKGLFLLDNIMLKSDWVLNYDIYKLLAYNNNLKNTTKSERMLYLV